MCFAEEVLEDVVLGVERCEGDGFPWLAFFEVEGFRVASASHHYEGVSVSEDVLSLAWDHGEMGLDRAIRENDFLGIDGEVPGPWGQAAEYSLCQSDSFCGLLSSKARGFGIELPSLMNHHPVEKPLIGIVFDVDLDVDEKSSPQ